MVGKERILLLRQFDTLVVGACNVIGIFFGLDVLDQIFVLVPDAIKFNSSMTGHNTERAGGLDSRQGKQSAVAAPLSRESSPCHNHKQP